MRSVLDTQRPSLRRDCDRLETLGPRHGGLHPYPSSGRFPPRLVDDYMAAEGGSVFDKVIALSRPEIIEVVTRPACEVGALLRLAPIQGQGL